MLFGVGTAYLRRRRAWSVFDIAVRFLAGRAADFTAGWSSVAMPPPEHSCVSQGSTREGRRVGNGVDLVPRPCSGTRALCRSRDAGELPLMFEIQEVRARGC